MAVTRTIASRTEPTSPLPARRPATPPEPPPRRASRLRRFGLWTLLFLGVLYILNPDMGLFEFVPDVIPIFGNLDEAGATALVIWAWRELHPRAVRPA